MRAKPSSQPPPPSSPPFNLPNPATPDSASIPAKHVPTNQSPPSSRAPPSSPPTLHHCTCPQTPQSTTQIPQLYRFWHLYLEPAFALSGALHLILSPAKYHAYTPSTVPYVPAAQHTYCQLAACYVFIAVFEGVFLRKFEQRKVWGAALGGLIWCDVGHFLADVWVEWPPRGMGWVAMGITVLGMGVRLGFLAGVGFGEDIEEEKER